MNVFNKLMRTERLSQQWQVQAMQCNTYWR